MSRNFHRRNLTPEQRLHVGSKMVEWMKKAAAERQAAGQANLKRGNERPVRANLPQPGNDPNVVPFPTTEKAPDEGIFAVVCMEVGSIDTL